MLNDDIHKYIFDMLQISDKRSYIRTCKIINALSVHMPNAEFVFQKMINDTHFLHGYYYSGFYHPLYKFTIELLFDCRPIPDKYIFADNRILFQYPKIYKKLSRRKDLDLIIKLFNCNGLSKENLDFIMRGAAEVGDIEILEWTKKIYPFSERATAHAALGNQIKILKWLIENGAMFDDFAKYYAAKKGHLEIFKYLVLDLGLGPNDCGYDVGLGGHIDIAKFIYSCDPESLFEVCDGAAERGDLDLLKYGYNHGARLDKYFECTHIHIFEWLIDNNHIQPDIKISMRIAWTGNLECLQYIHSRGFPILDKQVFTKAIDGRNIEMVKWLHDIGCPIDASVSKTAMDCPSAKSKIGGDVNILKLLVEWGFKLPRKLPWIDPARHGDLEMLKFLHTNGRIINDDVINAAAEHGCKWDKYACMHTIIYDHIYVLKWLRGVDRNKCEIKSNETEICPWNERVCLDAIAYGRINILKFAIGNGCECGRKSYDAAVKSPNIEIKNFVTNHYLSS